VTETILGYNQGSSADLLEPGCKDNMRGILFVVALLVIAAAGVIFASLVVMPQYSWASQVCDISYDLCRHPLWIGIIALAAGGVLLGLKATQI
jgi:hypothetical protein